MAQTAALPIDDVNGAAEFFKRELQAILTLRGVLLAGFITYLFVGPVLRQTDIVAAVLACSLLGLLILMGAVTFLKGRALRRSLQLRLSVGQPGMENAATAMLRAGEPALLAIRTSPFRIPPLFVLEAAIEFQQEQLPLPRTCFVGVSPEGRTARETVVFPHRGVWEVARLELTFGDRMGLTSFFWGIDALDAGGVFNVTVREGEAESLPVVSSSSRSGDLQVHNKDRLGDPFDLKPYHPSDGLKRILWKVYAKSGELISRHPEYSMMPEGRAALFCCADTREDYVCRDFLAYLGRLERLELALVVGFEGMNGLDCARSRESAEALMIESAWDSGRASAEKLQDEMRALIRAAEAQGGAAHLHRVVLFIGAERLADPRWRAQLQQLGGFIARHEIAPCFLVRKHPVVRAAPRAAAESRTARLLRAVVMVPLAEPPRTALEGAHLFAAQCKKEGWEAVM